MKEKPLREQLDEKDVLQRMHDSPFFERVGDPKLVEGSDRFTCVLGCRLQGYDVDVFINYKPMNVGLLKTSAKREHSRQYREAALAEGAGRIFVVVLESNERFSARGIRSILDGMKELIWGVYSQRVAVITERMVYSRNR